jgi:hypothetical protein
MGQTVDKLNFSLDNMNLNKIANPYSFCLVLSLLQAFFLEAILCYVETYKKKSESETHIWATRDSEESVICIKLMKFCYIHYLCGSICPTVPPSLKALENDVAGLFALLFHSQLC